MSSFHVFSFHLFSFLRCFTLAPSSVFFRVEEKKAKMASKIVRTKETKLAKIKKVFSNDISPLKKKTGMNSMK